MLTEDFQGNLKFEGDIFFDSEVVSYSETTASNFGLSPGDWFLTNLGGHDTLFGRWDNEVVYQDGKPYHGIVFPIENRWTTRITIIFGELAVGIVDLEGNAKDSGTVELSCITEDFSGNVIEDEFCGSTTVTSEAVRGNGTAVFYPGPGRYRVFYPGEYAYEEGGYIYINEGPSDNITMTTEDKLHILPEPACD